MPIAPLNIAGGIQTAQPVTAFMQGRAMRMAYESEKLQQQMLQMQIADYPKQQAHSRLMDNERINIQKAEIARDIRMDQLNGQFRIMDSIRYSDDPVGTALEAQAGLRADLGVRPNTPADEVIRRANSYTAKLMAQGATGEIRQPGEQPALVKEFLFAVENGFEGTFENYLAVRRSAGAPDLYAPSEVITEEGESVVRQAPRYSSRQAQAGVPVATSPVTVGKGQLSPEATGLKANQTGAIKAADLSAAQAGALTEAAWAMESTLENLTEIRSIVEAGPETGWLTAPGLRAKLDPAMMRMKSVTAGELVARMASARQSGVTFGQLSEGEWQRIADAGISLQNTKDANLKILDDLIGKVAREQNKSVDRISGAKFKGMAPPKKWGIKVDTGGKADTGGGEKKRVKLGDLPTG